ncbi:MAG: GNAT family N-acetyltransferase [Pseudomonadota bacterium]
MNSALKTANAVGLAFRPVNPLADAETLIWFGRDLYRESVGSDRKFEQDFGRTGARFPMWIAACAAADPSFAMLLMRDETAIGMIVLGADCRDPAVGHIHHLYVAPGHRGGGYGGLLDDYAREAFALAGFRRAQLNVAAGNRRALRFYIAQGWRDIGASRNGALRYMEVAI